MFLYSTLHTFYAIWIKCLKTNWQTKSMQKPNRQTDKQLTWLNRNTKNACACTHIHKHTNLWHALTHNTHTHINITIKMHIHVIGIVGISKILHQKITRFSCKNGQYRRRSSCNKNTDATKQQRKGSKPGQRDNREHFFLL